MLRTALVENTIQLEYAERQVAKEVQQVGVAWKSGAYYLSVRSN